MTKSITCPEELGGLASQVTVDYGQLAHQGRLAAATAKPQEVRSHALCPMEYVGEILYMRFNTSSPKSFCNSEPEMSDCNISRSLFHQNMLSDVFTHTLIRADVCCSLK